MTNPLGESLLTVKDVAKHLSAGTRTVYSLVEEGLIGHVRIGTGRGTIRFRPEHVREYLAKLEEPAFKPAIKPPVELDRSGRPIVSLLDERGNLRRKSRK